MDKNIIIKFVPAKYGDRYNVYLNDKLCKDGKFTIYIDASKMQNLLNNININILNLINISKDIIK